MILCCPHFDAATVTLLINNACIQSHRPCTDSSPLTRPWKSHNFLEPRRSLWISSSSFSPMLSLGSQCTVWWTDRVISSTPLKTLRYNQPDFTPFTNFFFKGTQNLQLMKTLDKKFNHYCFFVFLPCSALQRDSFELLSEDDFAEHNGSHSLWISETGLFFLSLISWFIQTGQVKNVVEVWQLVFYYRAAFPSTWQTMVKRGHISVVLLLWTQVTWFSVNTERLVRLDRQINTLFILKESMASSSSYDTHLF